MNDLLKRFAANQVGATPVEYCLIAALIALVIISSVTAIGRHLSPEFNAVAANRS